MINLPIPKRGLVGGDGFIPPADDAHRIVESIGEFSSCTFKEGDLVLGFIVEGQYRYSFMPSTGGSSP